MSNGPGLNISVEQTWADHLHLSIRVRGCLHAESTPFQRIAVYDSYALGRILTLGDDVALSDHDSAAYGELLTHPAAQMTTDLKNALVLGGGDGSVARELLRYDSLEQCTVVEIDQAVPRVCSEWFPACGNALNDKRCEVVIDDAFRYITNAANDQQWDLIIVDAEQLYTTANDLVHNATIGEVLSKHLSNNGLAVVPLGKISPGHDNSSEVLRELRSHFSTVQCYQMPIPALLSGGWTVAVCSQQAIELKQNESEWLKELQHYSHQKALTQTLSQRTFNLPPPNPLLGQAV